jgi:NAD(P)-dependent dehydrogenase (short-subunit alcohol dehydrogenase family)
MPRLKDKVAIVAGAGSIAEGWSNGKATAVLFAREGAKVFAVDRDMKAAQETCAIIKSEGGEALVIDGGQTASVTGKVWGS